MAKPFAALAVLLVVADGALGLDQPVAEVWPEYGVAGKDADDGAAGALAPGRAGGFPAAAADVAVRRPDRARRRSSPPAAPEHEPGAAVAEHALTYGHLCDAARPPRHR